MKYLQSHNRLADSRKLDAARKRLIRFNKRKQQELTFIKVNKELDKLTMDYSLKFSQQID